MSCVLRGKIQWDTRGETDRRELAILGRMVRTGTVEKVIFEQTPE